MRKVELLAPVGGWEALLAAVQNGADAVYLGGRLFGARANASNFDGEVLSRAADYCHLHGVKLYMTINTLVRNEEMEEVYQMASEAVERGIDAAIVQDLGVARMLRNSFPDLALHASTQMTIHSLSGVEKIKDLGFRRVVPARECTLSEISDIQSSGLEVEVFVHGALCVSYSGQCLLSSMIGGRSGNRGRCAQPCRLPYRMDDRERYYLSTADLCLQQDLPRLIEAGVSSLKIEGRLKRPEYVAVVTKAYRRALDLAQKGLPCDDSDREDLLSIFHRGGFTRGYLFGENDASVMATERPNHWGIKVGKVLSVKGSRAQVRLEKELHNQDGLEARGKYGDHGILVQGTVYDSLRVPYGVQAGDFLYRTTDSVQLDRARESYSQEHRRTRVNVCFQARIGEPCNLTMGGITVTGETVRQAEKRALDEQTVRAQLAKLGDSVLELGQCTCEIDEKAFLPLSALNNLRRKAAECYQQHLLESYSGLSRLVRPYRPGNYTRMSQDVLPLLVFQSDQTSDLLSALQDADELYYAPRDLTPKSLSRNLSLLPETVRLVLPNVLSDRELDDVQSVLGKREIVCGNIAQMREGCIADIGMNVFNSDTANYLVQCGAKRVTASPELSFSQAKELAEYAPVEFLIWGKFPLMTLRHCPIRTEKGLGGAGHAECHLCGGKGGELTDRKGERLSLIPYRTCSGCRVQIYPSRVYSALSVGEKLLQSGFQSLRIVGNYEDFKQVLEALNSTFSVQTNQQTSFGHLYKGVE